MSLLWFVTVWLLWSVGSSIKPSWHHRFWGDCYLSLTDAAGLASINFQEHRSNQQQQKRKEKKKKKETITSGKQLFFSDWLLRSSTASVSSIFLFHFTSTFGNFVLQLTSWFLLPLNYLANRHCSRRFNNRGITLVQNGSSLLADVWGRIEYVHAFMPGGEVYKTKSA